jgi:predicted phosphate transport protein (TIGR00153 family)
MIDSLSTGSYLPSTREDLINIATSCDRVANKCEHVAKVIVMQKIRLPEAFAEDVMKILSITHEQFEILEQSISMLFGKLNAFMKDHSSLDKIRDLESKVDNIEDDLTERIFNLDMELAAKVQLAHLVELICDLSDVIEDIADKIQIMLITRKA